MNAIAQSVQPTVIFGAGPLAIDEGSPRAQLAVVVEHLPGPLLLAGAVALSFPAGNVIIASAQDRDRDQLKTQQQIQDKDKLQTKDQLKEKEQLKEQERTRERTREQTRTERPERPQHEKAERTERGGR